MSRAHQPRSMDAYGAISWKEPNILHQNHDPTQARTRRHTTSCYLRMTDDRGHHDGGRGCARANERAEANRDHLVQKRRFLRANEAESAQTRLRGSAVVK